MTAIPVVVVGGYLGAGKTTLVNHLLRRAAGRRIAVLVNDFGEVSIDADLIVGAADEVLALAGGCVCCSFGADLVGTLIKVARRDPAPDIVLVECSGVGLPAAVARSAALAPGCAVEGIVVVVDAATVRERAADAFVGDTVRQQLREADLLLLNKIDRVDAAARASISRWLAGTGATAPVAAVVAAQVEPEVVFGLGVEAAAGIASPREAGRLALPPGGAADRFESSLRCYDAPVDVAALAAALTAPGSRVVRAKAVLLDLDGVRKVLQVVGRRAEVSLAPPAAAAGPAGRMVVIRVRAASASDASDG